MYEEMMRSSRSVFFNFLALDAQGAVGAAPRPSRRANRPLKFERRQSLAFLPNFEQAAQDFREAARSSQAAEDRLGPRQHTVTMFFKSSFK